MVSPKSRCSVGAGFGIGCRAGLPGERSSGLRRPGACHPTSLRALCHTLSPVRRRTQAHHGPGRRCPQLSRRLCRFRHLGPPSPGSLPQAFAEPETWKPRLFSASAQAIASLCSPCPAALGKRSELPRLGFLGPLAL